MREQLHAQVVHGQLAGAVQQIGLAVSQEEDADDHAQVLQGVLPESIEVALPDGVVDRLLDDVRASQLQHRESRQQQ